MKILAIETSGKEGSIALANDTHLVCEFEIPCRQRMAQALLPAIQQLLRKHDWHVSELQLICVTTGPGSFTGLRIGVTAAKMLAYCCDAEIAGVNTLQAIAARSQLQLASRAATIQPASIVATIDAQRKQLLKAEFKLDGDVLLETATTTLVDQEDFAGLIPQRALVTGTGLAHIGKQLCSMRPDVQLAAESLWLPKARDVARIGFSQFNAGRRDDKWSLVPHYFRKSAAEEKAATGKL